MDTKQEILIQRLHELLLEINGEAINEEDFNHWLHENYFFNEELEEVIMKVKKAREGM